MPVEWGANFKTRAQSAKPARQMRRPPNRRIPSCSARFTERRVGALSTKARRFQAIRPPCTYPHVEISSKTKFEVLGPCMYGRQNPAKVLIKAVVKRYRVVSSTYQRRLQRTHPLDHHRGISCRGACMAPPAPSSLVPNPTLTPHPSTDPTLPKSICLCRARQTRRSSCWCWAQRLSNTRV